MIANNKSIINLILTSYNYSIRGLKFLSNVKCMHNFTVLFLYQGRRKQTDIGGGGDKSVNLGGSGGMHPQIILKSRTPEIRFSASWEVIFYRKAHCKLKVWERVDRDRT